MSHRVNVMLEDESWTALQAVPRGERSQVINQLVKDWITQSRRSQAAEDMDRLRASLPPLPGTTEGWVREERNSH